MSSVTTIAEYPAASTRETMLLATSLFLAGYSWNQRVESPMMPAISSMLTDDTVLSMNGTPVDAAALAEIGRVERHHLAAIEQVRHQVGLVHERHRHFQDAHLLDIAQAAHDVDPVLHAVRRDAVKVAPVEQHLAA